MQDTFLLIDTSTTVCSVALSHGDEIIFSAVETKPEGGHAARAGILTEQAIQVLRDKGLRLSAIALSAGPGSYTGLRIGSSLAKGLCHGYQIPLIAISTLEIMANGYKQEYQVLDDKIRIVPMIDARRQEVYSAIFNSNAERITEDMPLIVSGATPFADDMGVYHYHFIGDGTTKPEGISSGDFTVIEGFIPKAEYMLPLAQRAFETQDFVDTAYWKPNYLKEYVAIIAKNKVLG